MSTGTEVRSKTIVPAQDTPAKAPGTLLHTINWSSVGFALLQNICAAVLAVNGVRIAIGVGSIAAAGGLWPAVTWFHSPSIRIPMMFIALVGAVINLAALWQVRRLRQRPSAQWRRVPLSAKQKRSERLQYVLSLVTIALLAFEYTLHLWLHRQG